MFKESFKNIKEHTVISPFLKWVGGKRQLMPAIKELIPLNYSMYYEPFVGGGAVLFNLQPKKAVINDFNEELINVYRVIKNQPEELISDLRIHKNEPEYYYALRAVDREENYKNLSEIKRASRVIYLNKTCYNGLYRVNSSGQFNTPFGKYKNPNIINEKAIKAVSQYLNSNEITILNKDFEEVVLRAAEGSFVYFDPPYHPISKSSSFTAYVQGGFDIDEQIRLRDLCHRLNERGIKFLLSNSATKLIEDLYKDYEIKYVKATRAINSNAKKRGEIKEVLIRNYN